MQALKPYMLQIADIASGRLDGFRQYGLDPGNLLGAGLIAREGGRWSLMVPVRRGRSFASQRT